MPKRPHPLLVMAIAVVAMSWAAERHEAFVAYPAKEWVIFAALAAGPMIVGHGGLNYALRYLPAYTVNVAALGEPVGATAIAWVLPSIAEPPGWAAIAGGLLALGGIALALARTASVESRELKVERND